MSGTLWHLEKLLLYETTKPYIVNLPLNLVPAGKRTNQICTAHTNITIHDIRKLNPSPTLNSNGFQLMGSELFPVSLKYEDFRDPLMVETVYCEVVKKALLSITGAESASLLHQAVRPNLFETPVYKRC